VDVVEATKKSAAAVNARNTAASKGKLPTKGQNQENSSDINVSKHAGNIEVQHTDVVVEVFPRNTAKGDRASKQVAKRTYSSNLNKSCSFITDV
jgi:trehalose-6-phosphatase